MRLILVRHGQTSSNIAGALDTAVPGAELTDLGREQARSLAEALGREPIGAVFVSTLVRTQQTAAPLAERLGISVSVLGGLREIESGDLEMHADRAAQHTYLETAFAWADGDLAAVIPGAESGAAFFTRYDAAIETIVASGAPIAVAVSHGAAIRTWVAGRSTNADVAVGRANPLKNTGSIVLEGSPSAGWQVVTWTTDPQGGPAPVAGADPAGAAVS